LWIGLGVVALIYTFLITGLEYAASAFAYRALVPAEAEGAAVAPSGDLRAT
jgi:hypothetical protein